MTKNIINFSDSTNTKQKTPKTETAPNSYFDVLLVRNDNGNLVAAVKSQIGLTGYSQAMALGANLTKDLDLTKHIDDKDLQDIIKQNIDEAKQSLNENKDAISVVFDRQEIEEAVKDCRLVTCLDLVNQLLDLSDLVITVENHDNPDAFTNWVKDQHFNIKPKVASLALDSNDDSPAWPDMVRIPLIRLGWVMNAQTNGNVNIYNSLIKADVVMVEDRNFITNGVIGLIYLVNR